MKNIITILVNVLEKMFNVCICPCHELGYRDCGECRENGKYPHRSSGIQNQKNSI